MSFVPSLEETKTFVLSGMRNTAHKQHCVLPNIHKMICVTHNAIHFPQMFEKQDVCLT